MNAVKGS